MDRVWDNLPPESRQGRVRMLVPKVGLTIATSSRSVRSASRGGQCHDCWHRFVSQKHLVNTQFCLPEVCCIQSSAGAAGFLDAPSLLLASRRELLARVVARWPYLYQSMMPETRRNPLKSVDA